MARSGLATNPGESDDAGTTVSADGRTNVTDNQFVLRRNGLQHFDNDVDVGGVTVRDGDALEGLGGFGSFDECGECLGAGAGPSGFGDDARSVTQRLRIPARGKAIVRILIQGKPLEVQVNDGTVPETQASVHITKLEDPAQAPPGSSQSNPPKR